MAKLRVNLLNSNEIAVPQYEHETLYQIFERAYNLANVPHGTLEEYFEIFVDGYRIEREFWQYVRPKEAADVLVALTPKGGDSRSTLGTIAILAVAVVATYYTGGMAGWQQAAIVMSATTAATWAIGALIPPPQSGLDGFANAAEEQSQMYSISGQSNQVKKYGIVPKVYGKHKVFPVVAANPYTELEVEGSEVVQYLYAIYDIGLGINYISELKIGETDFADFDESYYNIVDFNRPISDEGDWDKELDSKLKFYSGDVSEVSPSATLNKSQDEVGANPSEYEAIRTGSDGGGDEQEIVLTFLAPGGLASYSSTGNIGYQSVEFDIAFAEVGTEDWKAFNSPSNCKVWDKKGGAVLESASEFNLYIEQYYDLPYHIAYRGMQELFRGVAYVSSTYNYVSFPLTFPAYDEITSTQWGYEKGSKYIYSEDVISIGSYVTHNGQLIGKIVSRVLFYGAAYQYELESGLPVRLVLVENRVTTTYRRSDRFVLDQTGGFLTPITKFTIESNTSGQFAIKNNKTSPVYAQVKFKPYTTNQIKIRVRRATDYADYTYQNIKDTSWVSYLTRFDRSPIVTNNRHTFLEIKVKATNQLNGAISNLNSVVSSVLPVFDGSNWNYEETNNPAWVYADLLTGSVNKRPIEKSRLDTDSLLEWASYCDEVPNSFDDVNSPFIFPRFESNFVLDFNTTAYQLTNQIASNASASLNIINGKYGVLIDKLKTVPVQVFTNRNSWSFQSQRNFVDLPHAYKVKYVDKSSNWSVQEEVVYTDGYNLSNATDFEEINAFACTNYEQAWRYGQFLYAQGKLRQENITINVDFEGLVCTRGDYVKLQSDVMKAGGKPARVTAVAGNVITIDDKFETVPATSYGYTYRDESQIYTNTMTITSSTQATVNGDVPGVGDLIIWGEVDYITIDCLVRAIDINSDLTATLSLVEQARAVYDSESLEQIPDYSANISTIADGEFTAPSEVENFQAFENSWRCKNGDYEYYIGLSWTAPATSVVDKYEIYVDSGKGYDLITLTSALTYEYIVDQNYLGVEHSFKVLGVSASGHKLSLGDVTAVTETPVIKSTRPSDIDALYINVTNEVLQLDWDLITDCDVNHYLIRYSPSLTAYWESSIPLQKVDRNTSTVNVQARTGSYFIKAFDWNNNESQVSASAITSIPELTNLNIIDTIDDFPTLTGSKDRVVSEAGGIVLQEISANNYYSEGYYYMTSFLDLGDIYTCRLQSLLEAEGYTDEDIMANWPTLASLTALTTATVSDWNVEAQYRATNALNVMAEWTTLAGVDPISAGLQDLWTPWRRLVIGDFSGRIFQFRIKLISNTASISPRVLSGIIKADMPDRIDSYDNITAPIAGYTLTYNLPFKGPGVTPVIQITQDNASQGDYFAITNKSLTGFDIQFFDNNNNPVSRQFDVMAKGYGRKYTEVL